MLKNRQMAVLRPGTEKYKIVRKNRNRLKALLKNSNQTFTSYFKLTKYRVTMV